MSRIMIAAPASGSGKTLFTCGLLQALKEKGEDVISYKCGPDYIDPMFHRTIIGVPSENLDTFFQTQEEICEILAHDHFSVVEGVMGLYDGLGGTREEGSAYHLAKLTKTPIVLVIGARGMGRTIVSIIKGLLLDDVEHLICGVILNQTSESFYTTIAPIIEKETGIKALGFLPKLSGVNLESRHLGLKLPNEIDDLKNQLMEVAKQITEHVDLDEIKNQANQAKAYTREATLYDATANQELTLAVARDEAFCFYYEQNLRMFRERGVQIVEFSPLHDKHLPKCDGILLGGGYPELCAKELSENVSLLEEIKSEINNNKPSLAECGGFMYLHEFMTSAEGESYPMVGVIPGETHNTGKLCRFGYVNVTPNESGLLQDEIRAHEFHYYDSSSNGEDCRATKPSTGKSWDCMHMSESHLWGFPHLYYPSNTKVVDRFIDAMEKNKN